MIHGRIMRNNVSVRELHIGVTGELTGMGIFIFSCGYIAANLHRALNRLFVFFASTLWFWVLCFIHRVCEGPVLYPTGMRIPDRANRNYL